MSGLSSFVLILGSDANGSAGFGLSINVADGLWGPAHHRPHDCWQSSPDQEASETLFSLLSTYIEPLKHVDSHKHAPGPPKCAVNQSEIVVNIYLSVVVRCRHAQFTCIWFVCKCTHAHAASREQLGTLLAPFLETLKQICTLVMNQTWSEWKGQKRLKGQSTQITRILAMQQVLVTFFCSF